MKDQKIKSGAALLLEESNKPTVAGRLALVMSLLGGQEICSECGTVTRSPRLITEKDALNLLKTIMPEEG
jgi:hypothetical protein